LCFASGYTGRLEGGSSFEEQRADNQMKRTITGRELSEKWKIGARQTLYRKSGNWFHLLDQFPGALCDANGYILFSTRQDYEECELLQRGKELGVPGGIASIPGYVRMTSELPREQGLSLTDLEAIIAEIGRGAARHQIGDLQTIRAEIKGMRLSRSQSAHRIFGKTRMGPGGAAYVFHYGGGSELQFNIGFESAKKEIRDGVAFSFEPSRSKPRAKLSSILTPKVRLFNEFMELNAELFSDMRMWHYENNRRIGGDEMPGPIPWERVKKGLFIVLGRRQELDRIDYDTILTDMDRLLPLYTYVESAAATDPISMPSRPPFTFSPTGWRDRPTSTVATQVQRQLDVVLRHNEMQKALYHRLVSRHGESNVEYENPSGVGTRVDVVVRRASKNHRLEGGGCSNGL